MSIETLFERFRRHGDTGALGVVFDRTAPDLFRLALFLAPEASQAEDLVQATFLTAIESAGAHDGTRRVEPWLMGILANHARRARRQGSRRVLPEMLTQREVPDPRVEAERREVDETLRGALSRIRQPYRQVLTLHLEHGLNAKQIAAVLEQSAGTVRSQVVRGMQLLRRALPAGLGLGAAAMLTPGHALAGVRSEVLEYARRMVPPAPSQVSAETSLLRLGVLGPLALTALLGLALGFLDLDGEVVPVGGGVHAKSSAENAETNSPENEDSDGPGFERVDASPVERQRAAKVEVEVVDLDGAPIEGFGFELVYTPAGLREIVAVLQLDPRNRSGFSDTKGRVEFVDLPAGRVMLRPFGSVEPQNFEVGRGEHVKRRFEFERVRRFYGTVVDSAGDPVSGATVRASATRARCDVGDPVAVTDEDGAFAISLQRGGVSVWATAPGFVASVPRSARRDLTLRLGGPGGGGAVSGTVLDDSARPLAGAVVALFPVMAEVRPGVRHGGVPRYARTDERGSFEFVDARPGAASIVARHRAYATVSRAVEIDAGASRDVQLQMPLGGTLRGVLLGETGLPVVGGHVMAEVANSDPRILDAMFRVITSPTDAAGRFELVDVPPERVRVRIVDRVMRTWTHERLFTFAPGQCIEWNPGCEVETQIRGSLLDRTGRPVRNRIVAAFAVEGGSDRINEYRVRHTWTDARGEFLFGGMERGVAYRLAVYPPGIAKPGSELTVVAERAPVLPGPQRWDLTVDPSLRPEVMVSGSLVGPDGVALEPAVAATLLMRRLSSGRTTRHEIESGAAFSIGPMTEGRYRVGFAATGFGTVWGEPVELKGGKVELGELRFERPSRIDVRVIGATHQREIEGARVVLRGPLGDAVAAHDAPLAPGRYRLEVSHPCYAPAHDDLVLVAGTSREVEIRLVDGVSCSLSFEFSKLDNNYDGTGLLHVAVARESGEPVFVDHIAALREESFGLTQALVPGVYVVRATSIWGGRVVERIEVERSGSSAREFAFELRR